MSTALTFRLTVTDNNGLSDNDTTSVFVVRPATLPSNGNDTGSGGNNNPPMPVITPDQLTVNEGTSNVTLDGSQSHDPDTAKGDSITTYTWSQVLGPRVSISGSNTNPTLTFTVPSVTADTLLKFNLTVTDSHGISA